MNKSEQPMVSSVWVPPGHFYSPICDVAELENRRRRIFDRSQREIGVDMREDFQIAMLSKLKRHYLRLPFTERRQGSMRYSYENPAYSYGDAIILACLLMELRPQRLVEFGSGFSSCVTLDINEHFLHWSTACTFIDPYPELLMGLMKPGDAGKVQIVASMAQDVDLGLIDSLQAGDVLFIDSTHVAKAGSDVNFHLFEVLPRLASGTYIHFHDVFYPFEYPEAWFFEENRSWNEIYLLRAFLTGNPQFQIVFFNDFMYRHHRNVVTDALPLFAMNSGGALWLRKR